MTDNPSISYEQAGVSINANDIMVERISRSVSATYGPRVLGLENGFAGLFRLDYDERLFKKNYKSPVLVACTDGVGTKVLIAQEMNRLETIGQDLVAMNVNDMLVQGAEPLFFLDYVGINKLDPEVMAAIVESIAKGCRMADCALIGGETAEMPDIYDKKGEYDLAGFAVGVVERHRIITGKTVQKGDIVLGLASSGVHSNGYTLVRHILFKQHAFKLTDRIDELDGAVLGDVLLEPTKIYVRSIVSLLSGYKRKQIIHGMAHITGGGLVGNIPRVLPADCDAVLKKDSWPVPPIFRFMQKLGPVEEAEMFRVFNMGIGYVLIVAPDFAGAVKEKLEKSGQTVYDIGVITAGKKTVVLK